MRSMLRGFPRSTQPSRPTSRSSGPRRRGFTLIELLAVILIIGILVTAIVPAVTDYIRAAETTACSENLRKFYDSVIMYKTKYDRLPKSSGVRFIAEPYARKAVEQTKTNAERLTCPAVDRGYLAIGDMPWEEWWTDLELVQPDYSAYAGRDTKNHPLRQLSGKEPLAADDNDGGGMNHSTTTNVLYGDGSVHTFEVVELQEQGLLDPEENILTVGPDSPVEDLQKLSLD